VGDAFEGAVHRFGKVYEGAVRCQRSLFADEIKVTVGESNCCCDGQCGRDLFTPLLARLVVVWLNVSALANYQQIRSQAFHFGNGELQLLNVGF